METLTMMPLASFHRTICRELPLKIINIALCFHIYHAVFPPISFCNWFLSTPSVLFFFVIIRHLFMRILPSITPWYEYFNAIGVTLSKRNPLLIHMCIDVNHTMKDTYQRRRCCVFDSPGLPNDSAGYPGLAYGLWGTTPSVLRFFWLIPINCLIISMPSQKKRNTDGVESPCERWPGVGSSLANPGLSKEQLVRRCTMRVFILPNIFIGIPT